MKIRTGFVSNSSSSSFVLIVTKDEYDRVCSQEDPIVRAILEAVMKSTNVLGNECMLYDDCSSEYWFEDVDQDTIVNRAIEIANGGRITSDPDAPHDPDELKEFLKEIVYDGMGEYTIRDTFKSVPGDKKWSHGMDW